MKIPQRFGYEWSKYSKLDRNYEIQFWKWVYPLTKEFLKNRTILDAGCGMGRNSYFCLKNGAKEVFAFDYDKRTVNSAKKLLKNFKNANITHQSIYNIPHKNKFDLALCIGVIHHLEFPKKAISNLIQSLKKNGTLLIWVYGYEKNKWIVKYINPIRKITSRLPPAITHKFSYLFSIPLYIYTRIIPQKHPYLKQLSKFKFRHIHSIVFDQLLPQIARYYKKREAKALLNPLKNVKIYPCNNNSWTVLGKK